MYYKPTSIGYEDLKFNQDNKLLHFRLWFILTRIRLKTMIYNHFSKIAVSKFLEMC